MRSNLKKFVFSISSGKFLGYLISVWGIEAHSYKIQALVEMKVPSNLKGVQQMNGRVITLNMFISRYTNLCLPFFKLFRKNTSIFWNKNFEHPFLNIKAYLGDLQSSLAFSWCASVPLSCRNFLNGQCYIAYVNLVLIDAQGKYTMLNKLTFALNIIAQKLRHYFESHTVIVLTSFPLKNVIS